MTESLALELGPEITVNAVAPGQVEESAEDISDIDPTFVERAVARTPAGRLVTRVEVANVVAQLCTPAFDRLTGAVLPLDGGWRFNRFGKGGRARRVVGSATCLAYAGSAVDTRADRLA